jgi:hypothetical protein
MFDLAVTWDGRLLGVDSGGQLWTISACDASAVALPHRAGGNGLAGGLQGADAYAQGPPLQLVDGTGILAPRVIGGTIGLGPPDWCGSSTGDLAMSPDSGLLLSTLGCPACLFAGADALVEIDPATGQARAELGCVTDGRGTGFSSVFGLAFDSTGTLWGAQGVISPTLLRVDAATAVAELVPVTGGLSCAFGLAAIPCRSATVSPCDLPRPAPADVGPVLRVHDHGDALNAIITARLTWSGDRGLPRPGNEHYHVDRGTDPRLVFVIPGTEPYARTELDEATPAATSLPHVYFYVILAADDCERVSDD